MPFPRRIFFWRIRKYICYLDESGTPETSANSTHFVLLGLAIPAEKWKEYDREISAIKTKFGLQDAEIHTAWMLRDYPEQRMIPGYDAMSHDDRRRAMIGIRTMNMSRSRTRAQHGELNKNYSKTSEYIHLSKDERIQAIHALADLVSSWNDAVLFAEAQDKTKAPTDKAFDFAFEQVVTRFNSSALEGSQSGLSSRIITRPLQRA